MLLEFDEKPDVLSVVWFVRLEAAWGHLKDILKPDVMLDECVETLMFLQSVAEMVYSKRITDVGCMRYRGADAELENLA